MNYFDRKLWSVNVCIGPQHCARGCPLLMAPSSYKVHIDTAGHARLFLTSSGPLDSF